MRIWKRRKESSFDEKWILRGSYTIEIAFLLPMILTIMVILLYLTFFLHDRAVLSSAAYSAALKGSQMISGEDVFSKVSVHSKELIDHRLLGTKDLTTDITIDGDEIKVAYSGMMEIPGGVLLFREFVPADNQRGIPIEVFSVAKRQDAVKFIRECRVIEHYGKKISNKE